MKKKKKELECKLPKETSRELGIFYLEEKSLNGDMITCFKMFERLP